ncbi:MAG: ADP-ribose pyrophosphatase [Actinomycetota bacterium]|nr:MAG: ADP-ribose pyrophosphatase [Actinomycetota bacterium]
MSGREVYVGRLIRVEVHALPGGEHDVVRHPGAAGVLPITPAGEVLLVRQFRPAIGQHLVEIPAGLLDQREEDALSCAARELREETGYRHRTIEFLGGYYSSAGFTDEYVHLFLATTEERPDGGPEEGIELLRRPFAEMVAAARAGRVRDVKTALALLLAEGRLGGAGSRPAVR